MAVSDPAEFFIAKVPMDDRRVRLILNLDVKMTVQNHFDRVKVYISPFRQSRRIKFSSLMITGQNQ